MNQRKFIKLSVFGFLLVNCAACQSSNVSCSDPNVLQTVNKILIDEIRREIFIASLFDLDKSNFDIGAIRTQAADQKSAVCSATVHPQFKRNSTSGASNEGISAGNFVANSALVKMAGEIYYKAYLTDDGSQYIVNVRHR